MVRAHKRLEQFDLVGAVDLGDADMAGEITDRLRRIAPTSEPADGGHAGVVPTVDVTLLDELQKFALAHHRVGEVEASELGLAWTIRTLPQLLEIPVVERAMTVEFECAERMGGALDRIGLPVGPVVGGVHLPAVTGTEVVLVTNAVHHGITHLHVLVVHVDLRPQYTGAFVELAGGHPSEEVEVLFHAAITPG